MRVGELARQSRRLKHLVHPLRTLPDDYSPLLEFIGDARFVLLGASTYGTAQFEAERAAITQLLVSEKGFGTIATALDWADGVRITACVSEAANGVPGGLPFPDWGVRNREVAALLRWMADWNDSRAPEAPVNFYGLDEYCTHRATARALALLDREAPDVAERLRERLGRPGRIRGLPPLGLSHTLEDELVATLTRDLRDYLAPPEGSVRDGLDGVDAARMESTVRHAPAYYRALLAGSVAWRNLRARRLGDSLTRLAEALDERGRGRGIVLWLDSLEAGDARATDMGRSGELSLGQLVRERWARETVSLGFTTYQGTVLAAGEWGAEPEVGALPPAHSRSYEAILHDLDEPHLLMFTAEADAALPARRLERAIGPVLRPDDAPLTYFEATLGRQYDAVLHIENTTALERLDDG